ncbi:hypothetical protein EMCRGX_G002524 [Ephydatia muelleri]
MLRFSSVEDCDTGLQVALKDLTERLGNMEAQIQSVVQCSVAADGNVGKRSVNMLLDSGAAVSVIRSGVLEDRSRNLVMATSRTAIGANGLPLNVMGQVDLDICLGNFRTVHTFIVVRDLTFECILGADFLKVNKAVMDFRNNTLHLGNSTIKILSSDVSVSSDDAHSISVHALEDTDIPGRSVRLVIATLQKESCGSTEQISEGLIEPATVLPKHLLLLVHWTAYCQHLVFGDDHGLLLGRITPLDNIFFTSSFRSPFKLSGWRRKGCLIGLPEVFILCLTTFVLPRSRQAGSAVTVVCGWN